MKIGYQCTFKEFIQYGMRRKMKKKIVSSKQIATHGNIFSAEFWITHDPSKCSICKAEKIKPRQWILCKCGKRFLSQNLDNHRLKCIGDIVRVYRTGEKK